MNYAFKVVCNVSPHAAYERCAFERKGCEVVVDSGHETLSAHYRMQEGSCGSCPVSGIDTRSCGEEARIDASTGSAEALHGN